jgi:hypothetical protein
VPFAGKPVLGRDGRPTTQRLLKLRNPWGQSEYGSDGKNDGFFSLPMAKFTELYASLYVLN